METAAPHCAADIGIWQSASKDQGLSPDLVMACCSEVPKRLLKEKLFEHRQYVNRQGQDMPEIRD